MLQLRWIMKRFSKEFNGYNKDEVNAFVNDTINQVEKVLAKLFTIKISKEA